MRTAQIGPDLGLVKKKQKTNVSCPGFHKKERERAKVHLHVVYPASLQALHSNT